MGLRKQILEVLVKIRYSTQINLTVVPFCYTPRERERIMTPPLSGILSLGCIGIAWEAFID